MRIEAIKKILDAHSVPNYTNGGRVFANSMLSGSAIFETVEDVTDWSKSQLYAWLGY